MSSSMVPVGLPQPGVGRMRTTVSPVSGDLLISSTCARRATMQHVGKTRCRASRVCTLLCSAMLRLGASRVRWGQGRESGGRTQRARLHGPVEHSRRHADVDAPDAAVALAVGAAELRRVPDHEPLGLHLVERLAQRVARVVPLERRREALARERSVPHDAARVPARARSERGTQRKVGTLKVAEKRQTPSPRPRGSSRKVSRCVLGA